MEESAYLTAPEAAKVLGVKLETLYAYVSRGLIRSERIAAGRRRRYRRADVLRLRQRAEVRFDPSTAARQAFERSAAPILDSELTLITEQRAVSTAGTAGDAGWPAPTPSSRWSPCCGAVTSRRRSPRWPVPRCPGCGAGGCAHHGRPLEPWFAFQSVLPRLAAADAAAEDLSPAAVRRTGARIILAHLACLERLAATDRATSPPARGAAPGAPAPGGRRRDADPTAAPGLVARTLARTWGAADPALAAALIEPGLVLLADHELNVSTLAARTAASGRASPYQAVMAGLAAVQGTLHGQASVLVTELLRAVAKPQQARLIVGEYLRLRRPLYGFGHKIYRTRDPRADALWRLLRAAAPGHPVLEAADATVEAVQDMVTDAPMNVDLPLAVLGAVLELPAGASETLFIVARTAGWIAHAQEQYASGVMLRPRARYVGPAVAGRGAGFDVD